MIINYHDKYEDLKTKFSSNKIKDAIKSNNLYLNLSLDTRNDIEEAFKEIASLSGNQKAFEERAFYIDEFVIPYSKIIEWRNIFACYGYKKLASDLNFEFQYCLQA